LLATVDWRLVFLINVPVGVFGTVWSYWMLREQGERVRASIDWLGNLLFAGGLGSLLIGVTYGIRPYGGHAMGWTNPFVLTTITAGLVGLVAFARRAARSRADVPAALFGIRPFAAGNIAGLLSSIGRGLPERLCVRAVRGTEHDSIMNSVPARYRGVASGMRVTFQNTGMPV